MPSFGRRVPACAGQPASPAGGCIRATPTELVPPADPPAECAKEVLIRPVASPGRRTGADAADGGGGRASVAMACGAAGVSAVVALAMGMNGFGEPLPGNHPAWVGPMPPALRALVGEPRGESGMLADGTSGRCSAALS